MRMVGFNVVRYSKPNPEEYVLRESRPLRYYRQQADCWRHTAFVLAFLVAMTGIGIAVVVRMSELGLK